MAEKREAINEYRILSNIIKIDQILSESVKHNQIKIFKYVSNGCKKNPKNF